MTDKDRMRNAIDWDKVDVHNDSPKSIAKKLGIDKQLVYQKRYRDRLQKGVYLRPTQEQWDNVDWSESDIAIGEKLGISRQAVHVKRQQCNKSRSKETAEY